MREQITNLEDLSQLTIVQVFQEDDELYLMFRDKKFAKFTIYEDCEDFGYSKKYIRLVESTVDDTDRNLVSLGLISNKEYLAALQKEEDEYQEFVKLRDAKEAERISLLEKAQLETLKKKYE